MSLAAQACEIWMTPVAMSGIVDSIVGIACSSVPIVIALSGPQRPRPLGYLLSPHETFSHVFVRRCRVVRGASPPQDSYAGVGVRQRFFGSTAAHVHVHVEMHSIKIYIPYDVGVRKQTCSHTHVCARSSCSYLLVAAACTGQGG